jgi:hypothetical protein
MFSLVGSIAHLSKICISPIPRAIIAHRAGLEPKMPASSLTENCRSDATYLKKDIKINQSQIKA